MDWAEDLKFSIRKTTAKMGRRAAAAANSSSSTSTLAKQSPSAGSPEKDNSLNMNFDISLGETEPVVGNVGGPPRRKSGGWADTVIKSGKSRNKNLFEDERFKIVINTEPDDDNIPIIPDLDDIQDELLMNEIVNPPSVTVNRVVTLNELNSDLLTQKAFSSLEDIDLSILTKCLRAQDELEEVDELWDWEKLFTEITAEIHEDEKVINAAPSTTDIANF